jgi:polysaccharide export outer membrane protein
MLIKSLRVLCMLLSVIAVSACTTYRPQDADFNKLLLDAYRLDAGDTLRINVFDQSNLTDVYTVDSTGVIAMPLIGNVEARGRTIDELEAQIATQLRQGFLRNPDVTVEVASYRPFFIMGEVRTAGQYTYVPGMTVEKAIAIAGGFTPRAFKRNVDISRNLEGRIVSGSVDMQAPIRPGDTITVRERWF